MNDDAYSTLHKRHSYPWNDIWLTYTWHNIWMTMPTLRTSFIPVKWHMIDIHVTSHMNDHAYSTLRNSYTWHNIWMTMPILLYATSFIPVKWHMNDIHVTCHMNDHAYSTLRHPYTWATRPNQSFMFPYRLIDFRKVFYLSFSTNIQNPVLEILFSRIWSSAQDHAVLVLLLNLIGFFISTRSIWSGGDVLYHTCTSSEGASRRGQPLSIFKWFIGVGG